MAAIEYRHVVFAGDGVDGVEQAQEVLLGVDILLAVSTQQNVFAFFEAEAFVDVACLDVFEVLMQNFGHRRAGDVGALFGQSTVGKIAACMLRVAQVYIGDNIDDTAVGFLGQTFILAAVAGFHMEDGDMEAFGCDGAQAGVGVAEDEQRVRLYGGHQFV